MHWTVYLEGGPQKVNHAAVAVDDKIYTFGGYCSGNGFLLPNKIDVYVLHTDILRWRPVIYFNDGNPECVPKMIFGHTVVAHGNKVYLYGGRNNMNSFKTVYCFDTESDRWSIPPCTGPGPGPLDGHSACVIGHHMYIFGGFNEGLNSFVSSTFRLDLIGYRWEELVTHGDVPSARDFHTASVIGERMYMFGGRSSDDLDDSSDVYCNQVRYLDVRTLQWVAPRCQGKVPIGRRSHSAAVYNDEIYIIGGVYSHLHLIDVHKFNPYINKWHEMIVKGNPPRSRRRHCSAIVGDRLFLFGGSSPANPHELYRSHENEDSDSPKLIELSDLYVLDFFPSLKCLSQLVIIRNNLMYECLPTILKNEIRAMTTNSAIVDSYRRDRVLRTDFFGIQLT